MIQECSIHKLKEIFASKNNLTIIPVVIIGKIAEIKNTIIIQNEQYFNFIFSDGNDYIAIAVLITDITKNKIKIVQEINKIDGKIVIKEPRAPNDRLKAFNIDVVISDENPPIGTELIEYSEYLPTKKNLSNNTINSKTTEKKANSKLDIENSFTPASVLLRKEL